MNIEPIEWKISASFDDGSHMVTFPAINKGILLLKKPEMADIESLIGLVVAARDAQWQAALAEQEPDGRPALQLADLILSMDMATEKGQRARELARQVQERYDESPAELALRDIASYVGVGGYNAPWVDADKYKAKIIEEIQALATQPEPSTPAAQERAEPVAPAVGEASTPQAFQTLKVAIQADEMYAWSWHCVAWSCAFDEGLETGAANRAAARFMSMAFDTDTSKHPHFKPEHQRSALSATPPAPAQPRPLTQAEHEVMRKAQLSSGVLVHSGKAVQPSPNPSKPEQAEAPSDGCPHGSAHIVNDCLRCGAPVCCGKCCAEDSANEQDIAGEIAYQLTKRLVIDISTARAAVDAALATKPQAEQEATPPAQTVQDKKGGV